MYRLVTVTSFHSILRVVIHIWQMNDIGVWIIKTVVLEYGYDLDVRGQMHLRYLEISLTLQLLTNWSRSFFDGGCFYLARLLM